MTYREILVGVDSVGGYITDPIGKCLRTTAKRKRHRIDLDYLGSETHAAFHRREDLSQRFDGGRAENANLIWVEEPGTGKQSQPFPVQVDRATGIIQETLPDGSNRYGFLADVQGCVHYTSLANDRNA